MLDQLLNEGWAYHDSDTERLARELETAAAGGIAADRLVPFLTLSCHAIGEHLGDWPRAFALGQRLLAGLRPSRETAKAWGRVYVAAVLADKPIEAAVLELAVLDAAGTDVAAALLDLRFMLANALVSSKRFDEGAALYGAALTMAMRLQASPLLDRSIAVASNNLAWTLYEMESRTAPEAALMRRAADLSFIHWSRCGTWINRQQALYLVAQVDLASGDATAALAHAEQALAIIAANGARPFDAARLHLVRARALAALKDADGRRAALAAADAAAAELASEDLKRQYQAARAAGL